MRPYQSVSLDYMTAKKVGAEVVQKTGRTDLRVLIPPVSARRFQKVGGYRATDEIVVPKHAIMAGLGFFVCWHDGATPDAGVVEAVHQHALAGLEYGGGTHFDGVTQTHMPKRSRRDTARIIRNERRHAPPVRQQQAASRTTAVRRGPPKLAPGGFLKYSVDLDGMGLGHAQGKLELGVAFSANCCTAITVKSAGFE
jgi:hypothetical protein